MEAIGGAAAMADPVVETAPEATTPDAMAEVETHMAGAARRTGVHDRDRLKPGARIGGPAVIVEDETSTVVTPAFDAAIDGRGAIVLTRRGAGGA